MYIEPYNIRTLGLLFKYYKYTNLQIRKKVKGCYNRVGYNGITLGSTKNTYIKCSNQFEFLTCIKKIATLYLISSLKINRFSL